MNIGAIEKELRKLGYGRTDYIISEIGSGAVINDDFSGKSLKHIFFNNCKFENTNFDFAAVTGSIFKKCKFSNCSMHQPDFQFCNFYECEFSVKKTIVSSFNNCNFIENKFLNTSFEACTFTGALLENCELKNVSIKHSTLENALFLKCLFIDMDLRDINMDFVHIEHPKMSNVVLPFSQIPYMFGCLQYIMNTNDSVRISSINGQSISPQEYFNKVVPLLIQYWDEKSKNQPEFFFPLANVYIAMDDYINAADNFRKGLMRATADRDFRMIKFYCKLISRCNYSPDALRKFYDIINRFAYDADINSSEMRSFMRNIGEIREILFTSNKRPTLRFIFRTNTSINESEKVGKILGKLFAIAKLRTCSAPNNVELTLSENSPLMISLHVNGTEDNIITLLPALLLIIMPQHEIIKFVPTYHETLIFDSKNLNSGNSIITQTRKLASECNEIGIKLSLAEYHITNCVTLHSIGILPYYFDGLSESRDWNPETFLLKG